MVNDIVQKGSKITFVGVGDGAQEDDKSDHGNKNQGMDFLPVGFHLNSKNYDVIKNVINMRYVFIFYGSILHIM